MIVNPHYEQWKKDEAAPFRGWDFSYTKDRVVWEEPPWDYQALGRELVRNSRSVLDIATGGGEQFSTLAPFPPRAVAIEGWRPNVDVARERLVPLGVSVLGANDTGPYPFKAGVFDLVLNRHGGMSIKEIARVLLPGGQFLTQQVDGRNTEDLQAFFEVQPRWPDHNLERVTAEAAANGLASKRAENWVGQVIFFDVGAVVYLLKNTPWLVEGFSVDTHLKYLEELQRQLDRVGQLVFTARRFLLWSEKRSEVR